VGKQLTAYFFSDYRYKTQVVWFRRFLYLFLLAQGLYYAWYYDFLFGADSIVVVSPGHPGFFKELPFLLYNSGSAILGWFFIGAVLLLSGGQLFTGRSFFVADLLLWLLVMNLNNRVYPALTGGDHLLSQFLFFNCFLVSRFRETHSWQGQMKICLHNLGVVALLVQICLVYFLSALAKLEDPSWWAGQAIITVAQIDHFTLFSFMRPPAMPSAVLVFLNYLVLFYQLLFPLIVWIRPLKKPFLLIGILTHVYIMFAMGLLGFGLIMIMAYVFFWPVKRQES
jgi:hypothetical protein